MTGEVLYVLEVKEARYEGQSRGGYLSSVLPLVQSWTSVKNTIHPGLGNQIQTLPTSLSACINNYFPSQKSQVIEITILRTWRVTKLGGDTRYEQGMVRLPKTISRRT